MLTDPKLAWFSRRHLIFVWNSSVIHVTSVSAFGAKNKNSHSQILAQSTSISFHCREIGLAHQDCDFVFRLLSYACYWPCLSPYMHNSNRKFLIPLEMEFFKNKYISFFLFSFSTAFLLWILWCVHFPFHFIF